MPDKPHILSMETGTYQCRLDDKKATIYRWKGNGYVLETVQNVMFLKLEEYNEQGKLIRTTYERRRNEHGKYIKS